VAVGSDSTCIERSSSIRSLGRAKCCTGVALSPFRVLELKDFHCREVISSSLYDDPTSSDLNTRREVSKRDNVVRKSKTSKISLQSRNAALRRCAGDKVFICVEIRLHHMILECAKRDFQNISLRTTL
jgi:hypothetical protein